MYVIWHHFSNRTQQGNQHFPKNVVNIIKSLKWQQAGPQNIYFSEGWTPGKNNGQQIHHNNTVLLETLKDQKEMNWDYNIRKIGTDNNGCKLEISILKCYGGYSHNQKWQIKLMILELWHRQAIKRFVPLACL